MNRSIHLLLVILLGGCGGATESSGKMSNAVVDASNVCAELADSGLTFAQCIGESCCAELSACMQASDGVAYDNCIANCAFDGGAFGADGGSCEDSCGSAHPQGAAACRPYLDCVVRDCTPGTNRLEH
jgi:hypothetical protein